MTDQPDLEDAATHALRQARLRAALDGVELTPEVTQDEITPPQKDTTRDDEFLSNRPPHHG